MAKFTLDWSNSNLGQNIDKMEKKLTAVVLMYCSTKSKEFESYMKMNRPWTDRTGMAKATLNTKVSQPEPNKVRMTLAHGVEYGIWLELANEKNYAIIGPTINTQSQKFFESVDNLFHKLVSGGGGVI